MDLKWRAPEYEHQEKDTSWYWLTIIATVLIVAFAAWQRNFLFAAFIIIAEFLILFWGRRKPHDIEFKLNNDGLEIGGNKFYSYGDFKGYAVKKDELILQKKSRLSPYLKVRVPEKGIARVKVFVEKFLPEVEYEESLIEHLGKFLRF